MSKHITATLLLSAALLMSLGATAQSSFGNNKATNSKGSATGGTYTGRGNTFGGSSSSSSTSKSSSKGSSSSSSKSSSSSNPKSSSSSSSSSSRSTSSNYNSSSSSRSTSSSYSSSNYSSSYSGGSNNNSQEFHSGRFITRTPMGEPSFIQLQYGYNNKFKSPFYYSNYSMRNIFHKFTYHYAARYFFGIYNECLPYGNNYLPTDIDQINSTVYDKHKITILQYAFNGDYLYILYKKKKSHYIAGIYHNGDDRTIYTKVSSDYTHLTIDPTTEGVWVTKGDPTRNSIGLAPILFIYHSGNDYDEAAAYKEK